MENLYADTNNYMEVTNDFFPYKHEDGNWSGFYSTRPYLKKKIRDFSTDFHAKSFLYAMESFRKDDIKFVEGQR